MIERIIQKKESL